MDTTRRAFLSGSTGVLVAGAFGRQLFAAGQAPAPGAAAAPPVVPVFTPIRRNVGYFTGMGGTIGYLINPAGIAVIDSQFPNTAEMCLKGLNERSGNRAVDVLANTHHHGDHTGGNIAFKGVAKKVVSHARAAEFMRQPPGRPAPTTEQLYPTETFTDTWRMSIGDEVLSGKYYGAAHTSGDVVLTFEQANVAHMGDLMFNRRHPVVDRPAGASLRHWITVIEQASAAHSADTIFIFGHGGTGAPVTGGRAELMTMRDYLTALLARVESERRAGRTKEQIMAATDMLKGFEANGPLIPQVLASAYDELAS